jgi:hypothetical protein
MIETAGSSEYVTNSLADNTLLDLHNYAVRTSFLIENLGWDQRKTQPILARSFRIPISTVSLISEGYKIGHRSSHALFDPIT